MTQFYTNPAREHEPGALPDAETFCLSQTAAEERFLCRECGGYANDMREHDYVNAPRGVEHEFQPWEPGWYWQACFPGCLPDSEPNGPFATEQEAIDDARSNAGAGDDDDDP